MFQVTIPLALAAAYVASGIRRLGAAESNSRLGLAGAIAVVIAHALWLGFDVFDDTARLSITQVISFTALALAFIATIGTRLRNGYALTGVLFVLAGLTTATTALNLSESGTTTTHGWPLVAHILFSLLSSAVFAIAALVALTMTWKERQIRQNHVSAFGEKLPSLLRLEQVLFQAISIGFVTLSLAVFTGLVFIEDMRAQHLTHKTVLTVLAWIVFGGLLLGHWHFGWRGRVAARWTLTGFTLLVLAYYGTRLVLEFVLQKQWG